jgi:hypothetical protein
MALVITDEFLEQNKTERGGWTKAQLAILGVAWPPARGWKWTAIGKTISDDDARRFVADGQGGGLFGNGDVTP